jgi:DNA-binding IclR family transcriptional regulator
MLEVCLAISATDDRVNLTDLAARSSLPPSMYSRPIGRLIALGLLVRAEERPGDDYRVRWYRPVDSALWAATAELAET